MINHNEARKSLTGDFEADSTTVVQDLPWYFPVALPSTNSLKKAVIHTWPAKEFTNPEHKLRRK